MYYKYSQEEKELFCVEAQVSPGKIQNDLMTQLLTLASVKQALNKRSQKNYSGFRKLCPNTLSYY